MLVIIIFDTTHGFCYWQLCPWSQRMATLKQKHPVVQLQLRL